MTSTTYQPAALNRRHVLQGAALGALSISNLAFGQQSGAPLRFALSSLRGEVMDPVQGHPDKSLKLPLFDWLVGVNPDGTEVSKQTGLATNWETSPDGLAWTFQIREGVPFHKGNGTVSAEDVAFSLKRILGPEANTGAAPYFKAALDRIEASSKSTVVVRLKRKAVDLHIMLSPLRQTEGMVLPKAYFEKVGRDEFMRNPVGSGPYEFVSRAPGSKVVFNALPTHWSFGKPRVQRLEFLQVPEDSTRVAMLRKGEVQVIDLPRRLHAQLKKDGKFSVAPRVGDSTYTVWFQGQRNGGPFANEKVRTAMSLAIDRTQLVNLFGGPELARVATQIGSCASWNKFCRVEAPDVYDLQRAKKLLAESGVSPFEVEIHLTNLYPEQKDVSEALAGYWSALGLRPKIVPMDFGQWRAMFGQNKAPQNSVVVQENPNSIISASTLSLFYSRKSPVHMAARDDIQAQLDAAESAFSYQGQGLAVGQAAELIYRQRLELPLVVSGMVVAYDRSLRNQRLGGAQYADYGLRELITGV